MPRKVNWDAMIAEKLRREVRGGGLPPCGDELVHTLVDLLVQANVDLDTVSLDDMKQLMSDALESRRRMAAFLPPALAAT